jgi:hypothetical protein
MRVGLETKDQRVTTTLPTCSPASMRRWASAIWSKGKVRAIVGRKASSARPSPTKLLKRH